MMLIGSIARVTTVVGPLFLLLFMLWTVRLLYSGPLTSIMLGTSSSSAVSAPPSTTTSVNNHGSDHGSAPAPAQASSGKKGKKPGTIPGPPPVPDYDLADPEAPFVAWPMRRLCDETKWIEGVVYLCDNNSGGIGNIRNFIQICLRYAISAGATGVVIPNIRTRNDDNIGDLLSKPHRPFTYMFDEDHFRSSLAEGCPQMTVYDTVHDIPNAGPNPAAQIEEITPKNLATTNEDCDAKDMNRRTRTWRADFQKWLFETSTADPGEGGGVKRLPPSASHTRVIRFTWGVLFDWETFLDGPELYATFGNILRVRPDLISLGRKAAATLRGHASGDGGRFLGCHLRVESDSSIYWPNYDYQTTRYLKEARDQAFKFAYLATGDAKAKKKFKDQAKREADVQVYSAETLLEADDLAALQALTWDQRGIVDWVVLLDSDFFTGVTPSSFSILLGLRRHLRTAGLYSRPFRPGHDNDTDGHSRIVGNFNAYTGNWLFIFDGMWP